MDKQTTLNREIAKLLGWTLKEGTWGLNPNGDLEPIPDYEHDLNAVIAANAAPHASLYVGTTSPLLNETREARWYANINIYDADYLITSAGDTPQQAAALALMAWLKWKHQKA
jgi:hypothetical protein